MRAARPGAFAFAATVACCAGWLAPGAEALAQDSRCFGMPSAGRIEDAVRLPRSGPNFEPYSNIGVLMNRTWAHSRVAAAIDAAYAQLARDRPTTRYVYGESGWRNGGRFRPHRTHQNGTSVDFFVPVMDANGRPASLPFHAMNRFGYDIEFDSAGRLEDLRIDFEAIADHLRALQSAAREQGIAVERVIFDPPLLPSLFATRNGPWLRRNIAFMRRPAWVRHDEHYHVDFAVRCAPG